MHFVQSENELVVCIVHLPLHGSLWGYVLHLHQQIPGSKKGNIVDAEMKCWVYKCRLPCSVAKPVSSIYTLCTVQCTQFTLYSKEYVHIDRKWGGGRCFFTQIEPKWPLLYSTVPVPWLKDARLAGWVTYCSICASIMLRAKNRGEKGSILS